MSVVLVVQFAVERLAAAVVELLLPELVLQLVVAVQPVPVVEVDLRLLHPAAVVVAAVAGQLQEVQVEVYMLVAVYTLE